MWQPPFPIRDPITYNVTERCNEYVRYKTRDCYLLFRYKLIQIYPIDDSEVSAYSHYLVGWSFAESSLRDLET